jgi:hypothetical protein
MSGAEQSVEATSRGDLDHRGERRLSARESFVWYAIAAITYIGVGTGEKVLLTWFIGPAWLVATLTFGPRLWDRLRGRGSTRADEVRR